MAKQAVAINLRMLKTLVIDFLVFKPQFSRRLSRVYFSASSRLSRNFRGRLAGLAQIAAAGRLSRRLRGLCASVYLYLFVSFCIGLCLSLPECLCICPSVCICLSVSVVSLIAIVFGPLLNMSVQLF